MSDLVFLLTLTFLFFLPLFLSSFFSKICEDTNIFNIFIEGNMIFGAFIGTLLLKLLQNYISIYILILLIILVIFFIAIILHKFFDFVILNKKINSTIFGIVFNLLILVLCQVLSHALFKTDSFYFIKNFKNEYLIFVSLLLFLSIYLYLYRHNYLAVLNIFSKNEKKLEELNYPIFKTKNLILFISTFLSMLSGFILIATSTSSFDGSVFSFGFIALFVALISKGKIRNLIFYSFLFCLLKVIVQSYFNYTVLKELILIIPYFFILICLIFQNKKRQNF